MKQNAMLVVGFSDENIRDLRNIIMDILTTEKAGDGPKAEACKALRRLGKVKDVTVSHCIFTSGDKPKPRKRRG